MLVGQTLGPFLIEKELGSGAMGTVYRARYTKTGQIMAVKIMAPGLVGNKRSRDRFERESNILQHLKHPNIVRMYGHSKANAAVSYYAMEYIEGETLGDVLERRERMSWEEVVTLGTQLCSALQHAHEKGIIHRDLKPSNLMVLPNGTLKLTDFGIAKDTEKEGLTSANCTVGTAAYMSPEQCRGERDLTPKSDLYALGVVLYELITGKKPFNEESAMQMFIAHVNRTPERPSRLVLEMPPWLDSLIMQLLEKKPEHRHFNAATVGKALAEVQEKVEALQSAGADVANTKLKDKNSLTKRLDETDKEIARTLAGRGKRKKRKKRIYDRLWFQLGGIAAVLAVMVFVAYWFFVKPPSADGLYAQVQNLMEPDNPDNYDAAGRVINDFMTYHANDARAGQMQAWNQQISAYERETSFKKKIKFAENLGRQFEPENDVEGAAYRALQYEKLGDAAATRDCWDEVKKKGADHPGWLALANKKITELKPHVPPPAEISKWRQDYLDKKTKEIAALKNKEQTTKAVVVYEEISRLYRPYADDPEVKARLDQARELVYPESKKSDKATKDKAKP
jgi:tRNA A-37 threonylcarbamoyl transferase component Bud32